MSNPAIKYLEHYLEFAIPAFCKEVQQNSLHKELLKSFDDSLSSAALAEEIWQGLASRDVSHELVGKLLESLQDDTAEAITALNVAIFARLQKELKWFASQQLQAVKSFSDSV